LKKVLFVITVYQFSRETFPVLEYFKKSGYQVHVLIGWSGSTAVQYEEKCKNLNFRIHQVPGLLKYIDTEDDETASADEAAENKGSNIGKSRLYRYMLSKLIMLLTFLKHLRRFYHIKKFTGALLAGIRPDIVFGGPYQSCGYIDEGIIKACHERCIPSFCLPFSPYFGEKYAVGARFSWLSAGMLSKEMETDASLTNRLLGKMFPNWTRYRNGKGIFIFHPAHMLASWVSGVLVKNPWQWPTEKYSTVFVESDFSKKLLIDSRYDASKVVVAGKPLLDSVCQQARDKEHLDNIYAYLNLQKCDPFLLVNIEPSAEHNYSNWPDHWERFNGLMKCLHDIGIRVVLSLHPLCHTEKYLFAEREYGVKICLQYKIHDLYPHCYLSVSYPCSTNFMASIFSKDIIIYDFFGLTCENAPNREYHKLPNALIVYTPEKLRKRILLYIEENPLERRLENGQTRFDSRACANIFYHAERFVSGTLSKNMPF